MVIGRELCVLVAAVSCFWCKFMRQLSDLCFISENGIIKNTRIAEVMKQVDRANFCKYNAYTDSPQSIGYAVTISAPHMVCVYACIRMGGSRKQRPKQKLILSQRFTCDM